MINNAYYPILPELGAIGCCKNCPPTEDSLLALTHDLILVSIVTSAARFLKGKDSNAQFQPRVVRKNACTCGSAMRKPFGTMIYIFSFFSLSMYLCLQEASGN